MIICRRCGLWKSIAELSTKSRAATPICKVCTSRANAAHYRTVVKARRNATNVGAMKARMKLEQAIARVETGDSIGYAAWRVGVRVDVLEKELKRRTG